MAEDVNSISPASVRGTLQPALQRLSPVALAAFVGYCDSYGGKVGAKRRILAADVLAYKAKDRVRRRKLLDELSAESQRLGLD
ncbi:MAG: hypothetical protein EXR77_19345 [Myxococcales bacterium]|nr:hypothetical protein [Myxococcales bacterium]